MEITQTLVEEVPGFIQVCADGFVVRFDHKLTPPSASPDPVDGVRSKDLTIDSTRGLWARIFLPAVVEAEKLPLLIYFHGGGFCIGSTAWASYHEFLSGLANRARVVVVSVDYRLAPEHRLPVAYDDCFDALCWVFKFAQDDTFKDPLKTQDDAFKDPWLGTHVDYGHCFLAGESAGGNIVHTVGLKAAGRADLKIRGLVVLQPYFGSQERIECEKKVEGEFSTDDSMALEFNDTFWRMALPQGSNRDYPACNPEAPGAVNLSEVYLPPVLVTVAGLDLLKTRGVMYYELLKRSGKEAEFMDAQGQIHAYHLFHPRSEAAIVLQDRISEFIHRF
ncbi:hypothetical protein SUGI_0638300 [Cryptomeria japonica]|uniref:probable carboxylesterase 17 n=1 Tax=Cryptomeria japonica TaxID=3369 RepID=UPI0024148529|nr:probable carboxylesterase 17 [Cryptomeria japonica]GLJ31736.1 hypothetical protein SUGI_0638300 [Cryptomeria japonica]